MHLPQDLNIKVGFMNATKFRMKLPVYFKQVVDLRFINKTSLGLC